MPRKRNKKKLFAPDLLHTGKKRSGTGNQRLRPDVAPTIRPKPGKASPTGGRLDPARAIGKVKKPKLLGAHPLHSDIHHFPTGAHLIPKGPKKISTKGVRSPYRIPKGL